MQNLCIVQARMSSTRFPGKVLAPFAGSSVIDTLLSRLDKSSAINKVVVATSIDPTDDLLTMHLKGLPIYRGNLQDVRSRFVFLARKFAPTNIIRITGDCPLVCPDLIDQMLKLHEAENSDYTANCNFNAYPKGFDIEIIKSEVLLRASFLTEDSYDKEHVTPWMYSSGTLNVTNLQFLNGEHKSSLNFSVDTKEDLKFLNDLEQKYNVSQLSFKEIWDRVQLEL